MQVTAKELFRFAGTMKGNIHFLQRLVQLMVLWKPVVVLKALQSAAPEAQLRLQLKSIFWREFTSDWWPSLGVVTPLQRVAINSGAPFIFRFALMFAAVR